MTSNYQFGDIVVKNPNHRTSFFDFYRVQGIKYDSTSKYNKDSFVCECLKANYTYICPCRGQRICRPACQLEVSEVTDIVTGYAVIRSEDVNLYCLYNPDERYIFEVFDVKVGSIICPRGGEAIYSSKDGMYHHHFYRIAVDGGRHVRSGKLKVNYTHICPCTPECRQACRKKVSEITDEAVHSFTKIESNFFKQYELYDPDREYITNICSNDRKDIPDV